MNSEAWDPMPPGTGGIGRSLAMWRRLRGIKQNHAAELCGVSQATVSRWEGGTQMPTARQAARLRDLMAARPGSAADFVLARLVRQSQRAVHLVCDHTHRLLAASPSRTATWGKPAPDLIGSSLWRYASVEIVEAEKGLAEHGWFEPMPPPIRLATGANRSVEVPIRAGHVQWMRLQTSDGSFVRLVETEE